MIQRTLLLFILFTSLVFSLFSNQVFARHDIAIKLESDGKVLSFEKIVEKAISLHQGRVIQAEILTKDKMYIYEVEILDEDGVLWDLKFNASDGSLIESSKEE